MGYTNVFYVLAVPAPALRIGGIQINLSVLLDYYGLIGLLLTVVIPQKMSV